jgi:hypothetical protein
MEGQGRKKMIKEIFEHSLVDKLHSQNNNIIPYLKMTYLLHTWNIVVENVGEEHGLWCQTDPLWMSFSYYYSM